VLALSPVLVFRPVPSDSRPEPYLEIGVGGAWLSETMISWRDFGSHLQFEDRIGAGIRWRSFDFNFRYLHYSNAGLAGPNHGLDILLLSCAYSF
jgi:lipid A 3-O-deacylase